MGTQVLVSATWEAEERGSLGPRGSRLQWIRIMPLNRRPCKRKRKVGERKKRRMRGGKGRKKVGRGNSERERKKRKEKKKKGKKIEKKWEKHKHSGQGIPLLKMYSVREWCSRQNNFNRKPGKNSRALHYETSWIHSIPWTITWSFALHGRCWFY